MFNEHDLRIWDGLFASVPPEWREAPPSVAMQTCAKWLREVGAREVLDIGCGIGRWSIWLARQGFDVWGSDFSPNGISFARRWAEDEGVHVPFVCAPLTERAFPNRRFDAVVAALVLDLVSREELGVALERIGESLEPGGHLFAVFNPSELPDDAGGNPTAGVTLVRYSDAEIEEKVERAGFRLVRRWVLDQGTRGYLWRRDGD
jgi:SAM-dependent methyltransferase